MVVRSITVAALLATAACSSVKPVANAREFIPAHQPDRVWVVNTKNEAYMLRQPRVSGDSIIGTLNGGRVMRIPLANAQLVEAKQRDQKKTLAVVVIGGVVLGGTIFLMTQAGDSEGDDQSYTGGEM
jgi:hypothetical protein